MEAMEVDFQLEGPSRRAEVGVAVAGQAEAQPALVISDSGSSTELEDEEEDRDPAPHHLLRLPTAWAFSQRAEVGVRAATRTSETQGAMRRRRVRQGLRVTYPSQTAAHSRRFMDFHLRVPAANVAEPGSGSTTEVSESEDEAAAPVEPPHPALQPPSPLLLPLLPPLQGAPPPPQQQQQQPSPTNSNAAPEAGRAEAGNDGKNESAVAPVLPAAAPLRASQQGDEVEGEGETCSICFEPWTSAGEHRLAALRCGHLFGHTCIERWVKGQGQAAKCPQCNKKAKRGDIVLLYARKLRALDNSEQESMKRSLEQEQSLRRKAELESAQCRLQLQVVTDECGKLRRQLQELRTLMAQQGSGSSQSSSVSSSFFGTPLPGLAQRHDGSKTAHYTFSKAVLVSQTGGCRVLSYCEPLSCLLASQPSPHSTLVPGCGVKKVSTVNMKACQYVAVHAKQIRGLSFSRQADSLMLSAALDNTVKLTSLMTNTVVQTYNTGRPVWSCCWCLDNNNYIYAGLNNGSVLIYDTRDTSTHVQELLPLRSRCPVASLSYIPRATYSRSFPCGGLIAGSLEGGCFWEQVDANTYRPHILPLETSGCTDIQVEVETRHCLVTYRPGRTNPSLRCVLMELSRAPQQDGGQEPGYSCYPVQTYSAGSSCKMLTKNAVFKSPCEGSTLVCAGDEASNSTMVWNAANGALIQKLPADLPVVDICPFKVNEDHYLASLTEKMLKLYKWG